MLAAGVVHVSDRFVAGNNIVIAPGYTRTDVSGSYELAGPRLLLNAAVQNLTNVRYVTSGTSSNLRAGSPRRFILQISSAF
jgi:outer membrane receptor protein involved in Fe transport